MVISEYVSCPRCGDELRLTLVDERRVFAQGHCDKCQAVANERARVERQIADALLAAYANQMKDLNWSEAADFVRSGEYKEGKSDE